MRGHVRRHRQRWQAVYDLGPDPKTGKRRQRSAGVFDTKDEAEDALVQHLHRSRNLGLKGDPRSRTVGEYLRTWVEGLDADPDMRFSTRRWYAGKVDTHIIPGIGNIRLRDLERDAIREWYGSLEPSVMGAVHRTLRKALNDAVDSGLIVRNPVAGMFRGRGRRKAGARAASRVRALDWEELVAFLNVADEDRLGPYWRFVAATGCRRGEALGLFWGDLDLQAATATFQRSLTDAGWEDPKTEAGPRTVDLDSSTVAALKAWRRQQNEERLAAGPAWRSTLNVAGHEVRNDLVFTRIDGSPYFPNKVSVRFQELRREAGIRYVTLHDLRHTHATQLLRAGFNPRVVQERLGHSRVEVTLNIYGHVLPSMGREVAAHVDQMLTASDRGNA